MNHQNCALQFGANLFEVSADFITVPRVVHHDEQHGLLVKRLVFGIALFPFLYAKFQIVVVFLGEDGALLFDQLRLAGGVG